MALRSGGTFNDTESEILCEVKEFYFSGCACNTLFTNPLHPHSISRKLAAMRKYRSPAGKAMRQIRLSGEKFLLFCHAGSGLETQMPEHPDPYSVSLSGTENGSVKEGTKIE